MRGSGLSGPCGKKNRNSKVPGLDAEEVVMDQLTKEEKAEIAKILRQMAWDVRDEAFNMDPKVHGQRITAEEKAELWAESDHLENLASKVLK